MITVATFREYFPEFSDAAKFPEGQINRQLGLASRLLREDVWGDLYDDGIAYLTAHNMALALGSTTSASRGGAAGTPGGIVASKSIDKVSASYDTALGTVDGAGLYNSTSYGRQYAQWLGLFGAGGIQL